MSPGSIRNAERGDDMPERMQAGNLLAIKTALERGGVEFNADGRGVRFTPKGRKPK